MTRSPDYVDGLREAVTHGVDYGVGVLVNGDDRAEPIPLSLLTQARLAARQRLPLDLVLRRFIAAKDVLIDFVLGEVSVGAGWEPSALRRGFAAVAAAFDRLLRLIAEEYRKERQAHRYSGQSQVADCVRRLLAGERVDSSVLSYDIEGKHLAVIARLTDVRPPVRRMAEELGARALILTAGEDLWIWLGSKWPLDPERVRLGLESISPTSSFGIGEPEAGLGGWRLTHQQAEAASSIARKSAPAIVRYAEVSLVAAAMRDELLARSLQSMYLTPLERERDNGKRLRATLRAYFNADRNSSSASSALGVSRQAVADRLKTAQNRVNQPLNLCGDALALALRLEELGVLPVETELQMSKLQGGSLT
jgi:GGDEF-like domain/PucR C-terminal helix-turn-helix domain